MKIVNIVGGIGNQMFQYAFALSLKQKFPFEEIMIDISHFNQYNLHNGFEIHKVFRNELKIATKNELKMITRYIPNYKLSRIVRFFFSKRNTEYLEKIDYQYDKEVYNVNTDCYYEGYWQSYKYFENIEPLIKDTFTFYKLDYFKNYSLIQQLSNINSVAIHVRRGDYVNASAFKNICTEKYYSDAINYVNNIIPLPNFFIFSNDIEWCKNNISKLIKNRSVVFINDNYQENSYIDMYLMSLARCCIIANSSFSWWGAWLNSRNDKIIISPCKWTNYSNSKDIFPSNWVLI